MELRSIDLRAAFPALPELLTSASFTAYLRNRTAFGGNAVRLPAIIICPGGGYAQCSLREGEPVALRFVSEGFQAFVLHYPVAPDRYPKSLFYLSAAVAWVRRNAEDLGVDPERVAVCGFSAAGHLCASLGSFWKEDFIARQLSVTPEEIRPDAAILGYPVITSGEFAHYGSIKNLVGEDAEPALREQVSLEKAAGPDFPPTFLWCTYTDTLVPAENSLLLANRLRECGVSLEFHMFHKGPHGLAMCDHTTASPGASHINPHCGRWFGLCVEWLSEIWEQQ